MTPDQGASASRESEELKSNIDIHNIFNPFSNIKEDDNLFTPPNPANGSNAFTTTLGSYVAAVTPIEMQTSIAPTALQETSISSQMPTLQQGSLLSPNVALEPSLKHVIGSFPGLQDSIPQEISEKSFTHGTVIGPPSQPPGSSLIPPPPMFSNQTRTDSQPSVGKTILPPSVARRITSNHPYIKPQVQPAPYTENIFVPAAITDNSTEATYSTGAIETSSIKPPSAFAPYVSAASQSAITPTNASQAAVLKEQETSKPISMFTSGTRDVPPLPSASLNETIAPPPMFNPKSMQFLPSIPLGIPSYSNIQTTLGPETNFQVTTTITTLPTTSLPPGILQSGSLVSTPPGPSTSIPPELPGSSQSKPTQSLPSGPGMPPISKNVTVTSSSISIEPPPTMFASMAVSSIPAVSTTGPTHTLLNPANVPANLQASENVPLFFTPSIPQSETNQFFNPSIMETKNLNPPQNIPSASQLFNASLAPEPPKQLTEPPKATGILNYRLTKKRPQYYSGPIEGVGAISNNIKPVIQPIDSGAFKGNLFTPHQPVAENQYTKSVEQTPPFDISQPIEHASSFASFDSQQQNYNQSDYNTAFDLSRPTAERFEPPKQETKGFGLIGSLRSKLSSIDINKIQSSVTTFFDPAYNSTQKEPERVQENASHVQQQSEYGQYGQSQSSNFEIFVPSHEPSNQQYNETWGYQNPNLYNQNQYHQNVNLNQQNFIASTPQQSHNTPTSSVPELETAPTSYICNKGNSPDNYEFDKTNAQNVSLSHPSIASFHTSLQENIGKHAEETNLSATQPYPSLSNNEHDRILPSVIDMMQVHQSDMAENPPRSDVYTNYPMESKENAPEIYPVPQSLSPSQELSPKINEEQQQKLKEVGLNESKQAENNNFSQAQPVSAISFFDMPVQTKSEEVVSEVLTSECVDSTKKMSHILEKLDIKDSFVAESKQFEHDKILSSNPCDFFSTFEPLKSKPQGILTFDLQDDKVEIKKDQGDVPLELSVDLNPDLTMSSAPLYGLSTMLAIKTKELIDLENDMKNLALHGTPKEIDSIFNRDTNASFFENIGESNVQELKTDEIPDLNICETCREVNRPEDRDEETDDLTTQLIENIVSPIQLSNPVEVPLTESNTPVEDTDEFERKQCEEISLITEDTIETLQVQSATELLDDTSNNANIRAYGWSLEERPLEVFKQHEHDYNMPHPQVSIGFFGSNYLFTNASDEIKAEFYSHDEPPAPLPKQLSVPSAPPEEDLKLDEAGLDVHSIEQDATEDFPIFEEFVIEPSETDDDKIECKERKSSEDIQEVDSFTSRVEKFKKMEETVQHLEQVNPSNIIDLTSTTSPSLPIASYFDTGNYAAETHYLSLYNSLSSPMNTHMRVPPGFEEEYQRRLRNVIDPNKIDIYRDISRVPDTSTQTRHIFSPTFSMPPSIQNVIVTSVASRMSESVQESVISTVTQQIPVITNVTRGFNINSAVNPSEYEEFSSGEEPIPDSQKPHSAGVKETSEPVILPELTSMFDNRRDLITPDKCAISGASQNDFAASSGRVKENHNLIQFSSVFAPEKPLREEKSNTSMENKPLAQIIPEKSQTHLPDPINFFSNIIPTETLEENSDSNRLASYFTTPVKTENPRSFFELSQGQDHLRNESKPLDPKNTTDAKISEPDKIKSFFGISQSHNSNIENKEDPQNIYNISQERYVANLNLMKELTSAQNLEIPPEQIVRTINYFTVEYDNELLNSHTEILHKNEENKRINVDRELQTTFMDNTELTEETEYDDIQINDIITKCKHCCNLKYGYIERYYNIFHERVITRPIKVKTCMDSGSPPKDSVMDKGSVSTKKSKTVSVADNFSISEESQDGVLVGSDKEVGIRVLCAFYVVY